ncbi:MAG: GTPase Era [Candidatus Kaelpia aquatica]|nr:GTPase Era [Candidatus Kaelpia aquatica]
MEQRSADNKTTYSGFVAVIGRPNVGKSTLINMFMGEKVSIVSSTPKTTRDKIAAILTRDNFQIIFLDTPGMHKSKFLLDKYMIREAESSLDDADIIVVMIDAKKGIDKEDERIFEMIRPIKKPKFVVLNKVDLVKKPDILFMIDELSKWNKFDEYVPISATKSINTDRLLELITKNISEGPFHYPKDQLSDKSTRFHVAEIIREKILSRTYQELPFSIAVSVEEFLEKKEDLVVIEVAIYVEKSGQKAILIGKKGSMLKEVGIDAREEIEAFLSKRVYLELKVKINDKWRKDSLALKRVGYGR